MSDSIDSNAQEEYVTYRNTIDFAKVTGHKYQYWRNRFGNPSDVPGSLGRPRCCASTTTSDRAVDAKRRAVRIDSRRPTLYAFAISRTGDRLMAQGGSTGNAAAPVTRRTASVVRRTASGIALAAGLALFGTVSAQQPTPAQQSAIKSACRGDYRAVCASVQPGGPAALHCLQENAAHVSPGCQHALAALGAPLPPQSAAGGSMGAMAPAAAAPAAVTPAAITPAPSGAPSGISQRDEMRLMRDACGRDYRTFCQGVKPGGGHAITCLEANAASLAPGCRRDLAAMKDHMGK